MNTGHTEQRLLQVSQERVLALVGALIRGRIGREDDEHPLPPGPWDPVIRAALERLSVFGPHPEPWLARQSVFGPRPEPWKVVLASLLAKHPEIFDEIGGGHSLIGKIALNPQLLPLRFAFLAAVAGVVALR